MGVAGAVNDPAVTDRDYRYTEDRNQTGTSSGPFIPTAARTEVIFG